MRINVQQLHIECEYSFQRMNQSMMKPTSFMLMDGTCDLSFSQYFTEDAEAVRNAAVQDFLSHAYKVREAAYYLNEMASHCLTASFKCESNAMHRPFYMLSQKEKRHLVGHQMYAGNVISSVDYALTFIV